jgi:hypothetical protein
MGNSESAPSEDRAPGPGATGAADNAEALARAKNRLEELEAEPVVGNTSVVDDLAEWWRNLDLEGMAKSLLDDIEEAM